MFLLERREFPSAPCVARGVGGGGLDDTCRMLKSRASLTCFQACFFPGRSKDLSAPLYSLCYKQIQPTLAGLLNPLNAELNPICHLLALLGAHPILHVSRTRVKKVCILLRPRKTFNLLTPNDVYSGRTVPLTSKCCILYIYSTNIGTEYFKHGIYSPFFPLQNAVCFIILTYLVPVLFTFYIESVLN